MEKIASGNAHGTREDAKALAKAAAAKKTPEAQQQTQGDEEPR